MKPLIFCRSCSHGIPIEHQIWFEYFEGVLSKCLHCGVEYDWHTVIKENLQAIPFSSVILAPVGAYQTIIREQLIVGRQLSVDFRKNGIPDNAKIIDINYTTVGGNVFPLELRGNSPSSFEYTSHVTLHPVSFSNNSKEENSELNISLTWVPGGANDESWNNLGTAFENFLKKNYKACIIPANVAVESKLSGLLSRYLKNIVSKDKAKRFLEDGATYSHQMNVVLPMIIHERKISFLNESILGKLNRLRKIRNEIGHEGKSGTVLDKNETADLLSAALLGFHYLKLVEEKLSIVQ
jgi:hypothetical protein